LALSLGCALLAALPAPRALAQSSEQGGAATEATPNTAGELPTAGAGQLSAGTKAPAQALDHYQRGREHYLAGRYREALDELKAALALDPDSPNLVYNVARVNEDLANLDDAISSYQRYIELLPSGATAERDKADQTIRRLQGAKAERATREPAPIPSESVAPPEPASERAYGRADWLFWTAAGAGAALAVGGGVFGVLALQRENKVSSFVLGRDGALARRKQLVSQTNTLATASDALFIGAVVSAAGAALLYFLRAPPSAHSASTVQTQLDFDGRRAELRISGSF
jgi:tetratricopeptide (TPR) repeat protein